MSLDPSRLSAEFPGGYVSGSGYAVCPGTGRVDCQDCVEAAQDGSWVRINYPYVCGGGGKYSRFVVVYFRGRQDGRITLYAQYTGAEAEGTARLMIDGRVVAELTPHTTYTITVEEAAGGLRVPRLAVLAGAIGAAYLLLRGRL